MFFAVVVAVILKRSRTVSAKGPSVMSADASVAAKSSPRNVWLGLRTMVLTFKPEQMGVAIGSADSFGFIMEMGHANKDTKVTVVALIDGTMSLYLSTGGGTIGTGQRSPENTKMAKAVAAGVKEFVSRMAKTTTFPIPATGRARFFILTGQGVYTTEGDLATVAQRTDPLFPLYAAGQNLLTQIRLASEAPADESAG